MIASLIRRDPALRGLNRWLLLTLVMGMVFIGVIAWAALRQQAPPGWVFMLLTWSILSLFFSIGRGAARYTPFDLALPIPARRLWLAHVLALILAGASFIALLFLAVTLMYQLLEILPDRGYARLPQPLAPALHLLAAMVLAVVLLESGDLQHHRAPKGARQFLRTAIVLLLVLALMLLLSQLSPLMALLPLLLALVLGWRSYRALPAAFAMAPRESAGARASEDAQGSGREIGAAGESGHVSADSAAGASYYAFLWLTIARSLAKKPAAALAALPFVILFGGLLSGAYSALLGGSEIRFTYVILTAYLLLAFLAGPVSQLQIFDTLPLRRRTLFAILILPGLLSLCLGYAGGRWTIAIWGQPQELIELEQQDGREYVRVPIGACEIAWAGDPPENRAPWGEAYFPWSTPLYRGASARLYSPYSTVASSSREFVALQISRAVRSVYGEDFPPAEIAARYFLAATDSIVRAPAGGLTLQEDYPHLKPRGGGPVFPVMIAMVGVAWMLLAALYFRGLRLARSEGMRKAIFFGVLALAFLLHILQFAAFIAGFTEDWVVEGFFAILIRNSGEALPGGAAGVWLLSGLIFWLAYRLAESQFARIEVIAKSAAKGYAGE